MKKIEIELQSLEAWRDDIDSAFAEKLPFDEVASDILSSINELIGEPEPAQNWRVPTDEDAKKRVKCQVSCKDEWGWQDAILILVQNRGFKFRAQTESDAINGTIGGYNHCQILDEPAQEDERKGDSHEDIHFVGDLLSPDNTPTLKQRIEAQFEGKRVEMLIRDSFDILIVPNFSYDTAHTQASSLKGFAGFVYENQKTLLREERACLWNGGEVRLPVAVLFSEGEK